VAQAAEEILFFILFCQHLVRNLYLCEHLVNQHQVLAYVVLEWVCLNALQNFYIWRDVLRNEAIQINIFLLIYEHVLQAETPVCFTVPVQLYDRFTDLDQTIYLGLVVEPVLPEGVFYGLVLMVSHEIQHPPVQVFLYH
jgi:hypothetical protein